VLLVTGVAVQLVRVQADLENFAELIAARICAYIEKRTRTPRQEAQTGQTYE
jgi:hypothetical protein